MKCTAILLILISWCIPLGAIAQDTDKLLLNLISNESISYDIGVMKSYKTKTDKMGVSIEVVHISSFSLDSLTEKFDKVELIRKMVTLIEDPNYDWGANLVLYSLTRKIGFKFVVVDNREEWLRKFKREDIEYWRTFLEGIEYMASQMSLDE